MINIFEIPELKFNAEKLKQTYLNSSGVWATYGKNIQNSLHTKYVDENDVLEHISQLKNYKELIDNVKFFKTYAKGIIPPHTDKRNVAINIPIITDKNDKIVFYESKESEKVVVQVEDKEKETVAKVYKNPKTLETFISDKAFCLNTSAIHGVVNGSNNNRIILSISFKGKYDNYNLLKDMYKNGELI